MLRNECSGTLSLWASRNYENFEEFLGYPKYRWSDSAQALAALRAAKGDDAALAAALRAAVERSATDVAALRRTVRDLETARRRARGNDAPMPPRLASGDRPREGESLESSRPRRAGPGRPAAIF